MLHASISTTATGQYVLHISIVIFGTDVLAVFMSNTTTVAIVNGYKKFNGPQRWHRLFELKLELVTPCNPIAGLAAVSRSLEAICRVQRLLHTCGNDLCAWPGGWGMILYPLYKKKRGPELSSSMAYRRYVLHTLTSITASGKHILQIAISAYWKPNQY